MVNFKMWNKKIRNKPASNLSPEVLKDLRKNSLEQKKLFFIRFFSNKLAVFGAFVVFFLIIITLISNFLPFMDPFTMNPDEAFSPLSLKYPFGTDQFGRDTLSRVIYGGRVSLRVGFFAAMISAFFGIIIGAFAGFYGKILDTFLMRFTDALFAFPPILLAIVLVAVWGPGINNAMIAIGIVYIPVFARIVRSAVIANKKSLYVEAARANGMSDFNILFGQIIPNCFSVIIVQITVTFAEAMIFEAGLSFVGLGAQPPIPSWGKMLSDVRGFMQHYPLQLIIPGSVLAVAVLGFNLLGDGLRDVLDPRLYRSE